MIRLSGVRRISEVLLTPLSRNITRLKIRMCLAPRVNQLLSDNKAKMIFKCISIRLYFKNFLTIWCHYIKLNALYDVWHIRFIGRFVKLNFVRHTSDKIKTFGRIQWLHDIEKRQMTETETS